MSNFWCTRHWAPVPREFEGPDPINGILATVGLTKAFVDVVSVRMGEPGTAEKADADAGLQTQAILSRAQGRLGPACCLLGDTYIDELFARCRSSALRKSDA